MNESEPRGLRAKPKAAMGESKPSEASADTCRGIKRGRTHTLADLYGFTLAQHELEEQLHVAKRASQRADRTVEHSKAQLKFYTQQASCTAVRLSADQAAQKQYHDHVEYLQQKLAEIKCRIDLAGLGTHNYDDVDDIDGP